MNYNDFPFDRFKQNPRMVPPFGTSPYGHLIVSAEELPTLPIPKRVVVTRDQIDIDGWAFPYSSISKTWLMWFNQTARRWVKTDDSPQTRDWINGILDAYQEAVAGNLE